MEKAGEATWQGAGRRRLGGGGMRNAQNPSRMNKADVSVHLCKKKKQTHSALNGEEPKTNNPDGMQGSYPTLTAGHALHPKACEQQQQTGRVAG